MPIRYRNRKPYRSFAQAKPLFLGMLRIANYRKAYGPDPVLTIPRLELPGGIYWLKGKNGAGKTTLLKSVAGLIPFDGEISVMGLSLRQQRRAYTKTVSFAEAEPVYPSFLTGQELLGFYLQTKGGNKQNAIQIGEALGIASFLSQKVETYSSGMLKKLSLLLCFCGSPTLLLLDEPFITLDESAVTELQRLIATKNASFIISSHQELAVDVPYENLLLHEKTIQLESHADIAR